MEDTKIDRETMGRLAKALAFIGRPDDPVVVAQAGGGDRQRSRHQAGACAVFEAEASRPQSRAGLPDRIGSSGSTPRSTICSDPSGSGRCSLRLRPWRRQPRLPLRRLGQDHRHRLRVHLADLGVRRARQEGVGVDGHPALLHLPDARPGRPEPGEGRQRPVLAEGEPDLLALPVRPAGTARRSWSAAPGSDAPARATPASAARWCCGCWSRPGRGSCPRGSTAATAGPSAQ